MAFSWTKQRDGFGSKYWTKYPLENTKGLFHKQFEDVDICSNFLKKLYMTDWTGCGKTGKKHEKIKVQDWQ